VNPSATFDPDGYCRRKTENWAIAWSLVGQTRTDVTEIYGKPAATKQREGGHTELMFWKRGKGSQLHLDNATHFIVDAEGRVVSWHDPAPEFLPGDDDCEEWRQRECPSAPACGRDPY
jgi:hypothetical protein